MAHPGGRPPKWTDPKEIETLGNAYFDSLPKDENGMYLRPPTVTGLARALGTFRANLIDYEEKDEFYYTIKDLKSRCEEWVEENGLMGKSNATFSIFNLKNNYGWKDKVEQELSNPDGNFRTIIVNKSSKANGDVGEN